MQTLAAMRGLTLSTSIDVTTRVSIDAVIFDLDGVIIDTEEVWNDVRHDFAVAHGGHWTRELDQPKVMGANSMQWAASMRENNGLHLPVQEIYDGVIGELKERYARHLPVIPCALEAVGRLAQVYRLGVASSSPLELIEYALELAGLRERFTAVVSSDEVAKSKPEPDVYREACRRLGTAPERAAAVEDSSNGLRAARAAGLAVIAIPNPGFPPAAEALALADLVLDDIGQLDPERVEASASRRG
jgi:beta-phosphoglucomutase-like phosphatase (HAD superfamily)